MRRETSAGISGNSIPVGVAPVGVPIPDRMNGMLVAFVFVATLALLWLGSRIENGWGVFGIGVIFSYILLTNYSLMHEASHGNLQTNAGRNYWLGILTGALFPMPFTAMCSTHRGHHDFNRTDREQFDLYRRGDNRLLKCIRWYGILCGFFWPLVPVGALMFSFAPKKLRDLVFGVNRPRGYLVGGIQDSAIQRVRLETIMIIAFFVLIFWVLDLHWQNTLVLYLCFAFNWSTRQYVGHAFSSLDVVEGAWNLRHNRMMSFVLLHNEFDLNHHRHPEVPWCYLPRLPSDVAEQRGYVRQYWRQWLGPRPVRED